MNFHDIPMKPPTVSLNPGEDPSDVLLPAHWICQRGIGICNLIWLAHQHGHLGECAPETYPLAK